MLHKVKDAEGLMALLKERGIAAFPTAPLHASSTDVEGVANPYIFIGWEVAGNSKLRKEFVEHSRSNKSKLSELVGDINKFVKDINDKASKDGIDIFDDDNEGGDKEDAGLSIDLDSLEYLCEYARLKQLHDEKYVHLLTKTEYEWESTKDSYKNLIIGIKTSCKFSIENLKGLLDSTKAELVKEFPDLDPKDIQIFVDGNSFKGEVQQE